VHILGQNTHILGLKYAYFFGHCVMMHSNVMSGKACLLSPICEVLRVLRAPTGFERFNWVDLKVLM